MLFRREALEAKQSALYGDVLIATPMAFKVIGAFLVAILVAIAVFVSVASFARIEKVPGAIVPSQGMVQVKSTSSGVLTELDVEEGQRVERGEVVGRIVSDPAALEGDSERQAEINANRTKIRNIESRASLTREHHRDRIATLDREIESLEAQIERKAELGRIQEGALAEARTAQERDRDAFAKKIIRVDQLTSATLRMIEAEKELEQLESEVSSLRETLDQRKLERQEAESENRLALMELEAERQQLMDEEKILRGNNAYSIVAPATGRVSTVLRHEGHEVDGSGPIFSILPAGSTLQAELYVPSKAIGFVEPDQRARLLFDAFPYERFGALTGSIDTVSDSVILPDDQEFLTTNAERISEPVYRVTVALPGDTFDADGRSVPLQQGMLVNANIILEERTILAWILEPVYAVLGRS